MLETPRAKRTPAQAAQPAPDQGGARPVRHQPGAGQEGPRRSPSTTTTSGSTPASTSTTSSSTSPTCCWSVRPAAARRCSRRPWPRSWTCRSASPTPRPDRGRLRRRGRREHPAAADPGRRLRRRARPARDHLHRRDRQDRAQDGQPLDHARRLGRGRAAGAAEDPGGHGRQRAAAGRPQAPAPGLHPDRHDQHPVHLRRRLRGAREDRRGARRASGRSASDRRPAVARGARGGCWTS